MLRMYICRPFPLITTNRLHIFVLENLFCQNNRIVFIDEIINVVY